MKEAWEWALAIVAAGVIGISAWVLYDTHAGYAQGQEEYESLRQYVVKKEAVTAERQEEEEAYERWPDDFPDIEVDFEALSDINPNVKGWLYMEALDISYPIAQADDNEYYLHHSFEGEASRVGAIFVDYENNGDFSDWNTMVYGHNMRNGSMFGSLKRLRSEPELVREHPYFYIFTPEMTARYEVFSYYITERDSDSYECLYTSRQEHSSYLQMAAGHSMEELAVDISEEAPIVSLSTCTGNQATRFIIHGMERRRVDMSRLKKE